MKGIKEAYLCPWPSVEIQENFKFNVAVPQGTIELAFKWINDRWNCWVTLPDGTVRQAGIYPNVTSWSGFLDYGFYVKSDMQQIDFNSLFLCEVYFIVWE